MNCLSLWQNPASPGLSVLISPEISPSPASWDPLSWNRSSLPCPARSYAHTHAHAPLMTGRVPSCTLSQVLPHGSSEDSWELHIRQTARKCGCWVPKDRPFCTDHFGMLTAGFLLPLTAPHFLAKPSSHQLIADATPTSVWKHERVAM